MGQTIADNRNRKAGKLPKICQTARNVRSPAKSGRITDHTAFGMWKNRADISDVKQHVRRLRKGSQDVI
jgi:hypothetical protein